MYPHPRKRPERNAEGGGEEEPGVHGVSPRSWPCLCVIFPQQITHKKSHDFTQLADLLRVHPPPKTPERSAEVRGGGGAGCTRGKSAVVALLVCYLPQKITHKKSHELRITYADLPRVHPPSPKTPGSAEGRGRGERRGWVYTG